MTPIQRASRQSNFKTLTKAFKQETWYWEFVLLTRRIVITFMTTVFPWDKNILNTALLISLILFLSAQWRFEPFVHTRNNRMEALCLTLLITLLACIQLTNLYDTYPVVISFLSTIIVLIPAVIFGYYFFSIFGVCCVKKEKVRKIINLRTTESQRNHMHFKSNYKLKSKDMSTQMDLHIQGNNVSTNGTVYGDTNNIENETKHTSVTTLNGSDNNNIKGLSPPQAMIKDTSAASAASAASDDNELNLRFRQLSEDVSDPNTSNNMDNTVNNGSTHMESVRTMSVVDDESNDNNTNNNDNNITNNNNNITNNNNENTTINDENNDDMDTKIVIELMKKKSTNL